MEQLGVNIADLSADIKDVFELSSKVDVVTLDWIASIINLAVNVIATLLIVYRAWYSSRSVIWSSVLITHPGAIIDH